MGQLSLKASRIVKPIDLISCSNVHFKICQIAVVNDDTANKS